jgi:tetratricopeptide (TPR) repeat protein
MMRVRRYGTIAGLLVLFACGGEPPAEEGRAPAPVFPILAVPPGAQAISFLGDTLNSPHLGDAARQVYLARYAEAEDALAAAPEDVDALIWMGRRTAYLGQYREAIDIYSHGLTIHPDNAQLYRHRGHRYITVREPDNAIADFERAADLTNGLPDEVEQDGLPNDQNIPTSTLQFNIFYHLGLAHYIKGDLEAALATYRSCLAVSVHPDSVVATSYWLYMTLMRLGMEADAQRVLADINEDMDIIESTAYLDLLLLFKGERTLEDLLGPDGANATLQSTTMGYGLGVSHLLNGRYSEAYETFERVTSGIRQWAAFGFVASEAELARREPAS